MNAIVIVIAFLGTLWAGVYLCMHDFPVLGGWVCILSLFMSWSASSSGKKETRW